MQSNQNETKSGKFKPDYYVLLLLLMSGCSVAPDYDAPSPPQVEGYTSGALPAETVSTKSAGGEAQHFKMGAQLSGQWWHLFHSPELDAIIKQALADNPNLAAAKASLRQAHEAVRAAEGGVFPQIDANAGYSHQKSSFVQFGENMAVPSFDLYSLGGTASYSLDVFGGVRSGIEEASSLEELGRDEIAAAYITLTGSVVVQTINLASAMAEIAAVDRIIAADQDNLRLLDKAVRQGVMAEQGPEVLSLQSQLAADQNLRPPLLQRRDAAGHALAALLGRTPAQWRAPGFTMAHLTLPSDLPVSMPSALVAQRPDIRAAEARLHAASAAIGIATANMLPNITLSADYSRNGLSLEDIFSPIGIVSDLAAQIAAPIFHGGTLLAQKREAEAAYDTAKAQYQNTVVQAFQQVADILRALEHDAELVAAEQNSISAADKSLTAARRSFSAGTNGYLDVLDAARQYNEAQLNYVRAVAQRYQDTAQLFVALGGGWWNNPHYPAERPTKPTIMAQREEKAGHE